MALVVEDGTGLANADALVSVAEADAYFAARGNAAWAALTSDVKEQRIVLATDYIETLFGARFRGDEQFPDVQALSFPRTGIGHDGAVPLGIRRAAAEYALRAGTALMPDPATDASGRLAVEVAKKVGPIETTTKYAESGALSSAPAVRSYPAADALVAPFLRKASGVYR